VEHLNKCIWCGDEAVRAMGYLEGEEKYSNICAFCYSNVPCDLIDSKTKGEDLNINLCRHSAKTLRSKIDPIVNVDFSTSDLCQWCLERPVACNGTLCSLCYTTVNKELVVNLNNSALWEVYLHNLEYELKRKNKEELAKQNSFTGADLFSPFSGSQEMEIRRLKNRMSNFENEIHYLFCMFRSLDPNLTDERS
jgi:hypothetical protein